MNVVMKRKIYSQLLEWKNTSASREALLVEGARRIGKSYIVEEFAKKEYKSYILFDFSKISREIKDIFDNYLTDQDTFFRLLYLQTGVKLYPGNSLIIFDEVQRYPRAREAVKELVREHRYHYIETGSLVGIHTNTKDILIPSEEHRINMYPMDFEEFLWAMNEEDLANYIRECFEQRIALPQAIHRKAMDWLRQYMLVGGMPQAVESYALLHDFEEVEKIKMNILDLYRQDMFHYAGAQANKVARVWDIIPGELQRKPKRFRVGSLQKGARMRDYETALFWLNEARVVNPCWNTTEPNLGMKLNADYSKFKLYVGDTGLLVSLSMDEDEQNRLELYRKLMLSKLEINQGMFVENLVAQMLRANGKKLFYYSNADKQNAKEHYEIDFLIRKQGVTSRHNICPVEVKSSQRYTLSSLMRFNIKYKEYLSTPIVIHSGPLKQEESLIYLPLYMAFCL